MLVEHARASAVGRILQTRTAGPYYARGWAGGGARALRRELIAQ